MLSTIIGALLAGIIIGPLARLALPGRQDISVLGTFLSGAIGALVGGLIAGLLGVGDTNGIDWIQLLISVAVGVLAIIGYMAITKKE